MPHKLGDIVQALYSIDRGLRQRDIHLDGEIVEIIPSGGRPRARTNGRLVVAQKITTYVVKTSRWFLWLNPSEILFSKPTLELPLKPKRMVK